MSLTKGLEMLTMFPVGAFSGNDGPQVFMTDNCDELRTSVYAK